MKNVYLLSGFPVCTYYSIIYFQYDSKELIPRFSLIHFYCRYPHRNAITGKKKTHSCKWQFIRSGESRSKPVDMLSNCICRHYQRAFRTTLFFFHFILYLFFSYILGNNILIMPSLRLFFLSFSLSFFKCEGACCMSVSHGLFFLREFPRLCTDRSYYPRGSLRTGLKARTSIRLSLISSDVFSNLLIWD